MPDKQYVYAGYVGASSLPEVTRAQAKKLTHLNIAFAVVEDGIFSIEHIGHYMPYIEAIRSYNPTLNILISTGGGDQRGHGEATRTLAGLARLVGSCMDIVREFDLDGIDCDWEFPCDRGDMDERFQYTALLQAYQAELDIYAKARGRRAWLTAAWGVGPWGLLCVEVPKVIEVLDFINMMSYDLNDYGVGIFEMLEAYAKRNMTFNPPAATVAGHHSNLYPTFGDPGPMCAQDGVRFYNMAGIPNEKIVIGAAFYSKQWNGVPGGGTHGLHQRASSRCSFGSGRCSYDEIRAAFELNPDYIKYWDDAAQACWLYNGDQFITYEDPKAVTAKCRFARENALRGMMYWVHGCDPSSILFNMIYDHLML